MVPGRGTPSADGGVRSGGDHRLRQPLPLQLETRRHAWPGMPRPRVPSAAGIAAAAFVDEPVGKMVCLTLSAIGVYSCSPVFWTLAPNFLTGPSAAVGIAFINSVAALGAFVAPWLIGLLKDATGSYSYGLLMLAALVVAGGLLVLSIKHDIVLEHAPEQPLPA